MSFKTLVTMLALSVFAFVLFDFGKAYLQSAATGWQRFIDAGKGSATLVVAQLGALTAALLAAGDTVTDWVCGLLTTPEVAEQIKAVIGQWVTTTNVGIAMLIFTGLVTWARLRTLKRG